MARTPYASRVWPKLRLAILERDEWKCQIHGPRCIGVANEADHIIPWLSGGSWFEPANLRAACQPCNGSRVRYVPIDTDTPTQPSRTW